MSLSRRERREFAKRLGILSRKESYSEMIRRFKRSNEAGSHIHTHHLQEIKNSQIESRELGEEDLENDNINPYGFLGKNKN